MEEIISGLEFDGSFSEFLTFLRTDPQFYHKDAESLLDGYRVLCKKVDAELPKLFMTLPRTPYGVKPIPEYQAPSAPTAYYHGPSADGKRAGFFWANTYQLDTRPKYEMAVLALHEAVPGHHLQIALANELVNVPEFRKHSGYTAYIEGWALYAESLGEEMEMYEDPYDKFGQLTYEMWRACRLVIDTGIHAYGWTRQQAIDYLLINSAKTQHDAEVEIDRYIIWPGQALAYKIGELKIKELKEMAEEKLGDKFDIREFHHIILKDGAMPLNMLENKINSFIQNKL
jgi:prolyl oligopeptidase